MSAVRFESNAVEMTTAKHCTYLTWQQTLTCLILLIDFPQTDNIFMRFLSASRSYQSLTKSISVMCDARVVGSFYHFVPQNLSFLSGNLNKGHLSLLVCFDISFNFDWLRMRLAYFLANQN